FGGSAAQKRMSAPSQRRNFMFHDRIRAMAQLSAATILSALIGCAGTKINTPTVEGSPVGNIGGGTIDGAAENKQKEESKECRRCQRIEDRIDDNESALNDPGASKEWKARIRQEMPFLKHQRERCSAVACGASLSRRTPAG